MHNRSQSFSIHVHSYRTAIQCKLDALKEDSQPEENPSDKVFSESTHGFLIYAEEHRDVNKILLGSLLWCIQLALYSLLWHEAWNKIIEDQIEVTVSHKHCNGHTMNIASDANAYYPAKYPNYIEASSLQCDTDVIGHSFLYHLLLPTVLLAMYVQSDFVSCFSVIFTHKGCFRKMIALIVLSESMFALYTGLLWCYQGIYKGSRYDSIINAVGVIFIHELDEQLFAATERLIQSEMLKNSKRCRCFSKFASLVTTLVFLTFVFFSGVVIKESAEARIQSM